MVNQKRIEQKLPLLITNGCTLSWEYQHRQILVNKLKHRSPERYAANLNRIISDLGAFEKDVVSMASKKKT